jgi:hypothetical protein
VRLLQDSGFQAAFAPIRVKFKPTPADMQTAEESGTDLAQAVSRKRKAAAKQTSKAASAGACHACMYTRQTYVNSVHQLRSSEAAGLPQGGWVGLIEHGTRADPGPAQCHWVCSGAAITARREQGACAD